MIEQAINKLNDEMNKNKNPYVQVVGQFLVQHIKANPEVANKILQDGKTIMKSLDEMRKEAEKKKVGNCAVLTDQEGFEIVLKYFDINGKIGTVSPVKVEKQTDIKPTEGNIKPKKSIDFDVNLDELI